MADSTGSKQEPARIAVTNQKGGVGKSTTAIHLAGGLNQRGHKVLLVDIDPQGNATSNLGHKEYFSDLNIDVTISDILTDNKYLSSGEGDLAEDVPKLIASVEEFDLLRANEGMNEGLVEELSSVSHPGQRLTNALEPIENEYDYVIVDSPPALNKLTTNALVYTRNLLVPTYPERMSIGGLSLLYDHVEAVQNFQEDVSYAGFIVNRIENNNEANEVINALESEFGGNFPLWMIRKRIALRRAITESKGSIFIHNEEDEFKLTFYDMAAWLDGYFGISSDVTLEDVFTEEEVREAVVNGQIDPEDLEQIGDEVAKIAGKAERRE